MSAKDPIRLPIELQEQFLITAIALDRDDWPRRTLTNYCLVSKAFLHITRFHYFPIVEIQMPTKIMAFQDIITNSSISQWTLVPYIHKVQIRITPGNDRVIQSMILAIPSMPNVWDLTVRCNRPPLPSIHRVWQNVRRLRFEEPTAVDSLDNLGKLIVGFTTLESLHLHANWQMYIPHRARRIEFRDLRSELSGAILHRHKDIERLIIHDLLPTSLNIMQQSINDCGKSLLELVMNAGCTNLWPRRLTLTRAMYLQKLTLWSGVPMESLLNSYTQFLHTLNSRHLVFLYIHLAENLTKAERNLILLDSIIPHSVARFCLDIIDTQGLKQLVPEWDGRGLWVRVRFPMRDSRGIFTVICELVQRPRDIVDIISSS